MRRLIIPVSAVLFFIVLALFFGALGALGTLGARERGVPPRPETRPTKRPSPINPAFVRARGENLVVGKANKRIFLRGVNLSYDRVSERFCGGGDWRMADHTDWGTPVACWYQEKHFKMLRDIGFNSVRINLSYRIFEDNAQPGKWKLSGWRLLDRLVSWGKKYGLYLILDMHIAPGGAGIVACRGCGYRTWDEPEYQRRFKALWKAVATRYSGEPRIAAYDLLNEPVPTKNASQWRALAQSLVKEIRGVDKNHLLIVEMVNWIFDRKNRSPLADFDRKTLKSFQFLLDDPGIIYDFHDYIPKAYTLQYETGTDGGGYPDASRKERTIAGGRKPRDRLLLAREMDRVIAFWKTLRKPVNFGEWGTEGNVRNGGDAYTKDMLALMDERGLNWQFYFMNRLFDIQCCYDDNPTSAKSAALIKTFKDYFHGKREKKPGRGR